MFIKGVSPADSNYREGILLELKANYENWTWPVSLSGSLIQKQEKWQAIRQFQTIVINQGCCSGTFSIFILNSTGGKSNESINEK